MKILLIRFSSIGDIVLTFPCIRLIKKQFPNAEIHYLTKQTFAPLIAHHPDIAYQWLYNGKNLSQIIQQLRNFTFDYVIDLHNNLRSLYVSFWLRYKHYSKLDKRNFQKWRMVWLKERSVVPHVVHRYLKTLPFLHNENLTSLPLEYFHGEHAEQNAFHILQANGFEPDNYVAIVLSATHATKKWLPKYYVELINKLSFPVVLMGGKTEEKEAENLMKNLNAPQPCMNLVGQTDLNTSAAFIKHSRMVLCNDTGMMHIACAFQKKMVVLWGNTCPELGFAPYQNPNATNLSLVLSCKPCDKIGRHSCPQKHFNCMTKLTPDLVYQTIVKALLDSE